MALLKQTWAVMVLLSWGSASAAGSCLPPVQPWMPTNADDVQEYADLLRRDAETYFADVAILPTTARSIKNKRYQEEIRLFFIVFFRARFLANRFCIS